MTYDYSKPQATAGKLLAKFGRSGVIRRNGAITGGTVYSPVYGTVDYPCTLAVMKWSANEIDGTRIRADDLRVYVSAVGLAIEPGTADKLVIGSDVYAIINSVPLRPAETVVMYTLQCRK